MNAQASFLKIAEFVYWLCAVIDFPSVWKELWLESRWWQAWNDQTERVKIMAIFLYCSKVVPVYHWQVCYFCSSAVYK